MGVVCAACAWDMHTSCTELGTRTEAEENHAARASRSG